LCKEFKEALIEENMYLTAAVGMGIETIDKGYEVDEIIK
jgi:hypothetical protein